MVTCRRSIVFLTSNVSHEDVLIPSCEDFKCSLGYIACIVVSASYSITHSMVIILRYKREETLRLGMPLAAPDLNVFRR